MTQKQILQFIFFLVVFTSFSNVLTAQSLKQVKPEEVGFSTERLTYLTKTFQQYSKDKELAGSVILVARHGKVAYFEADGYQDVTQNIPMQKNSMFRIASQTKAIVSVGIMMLQEEGKLLISDPVGKYIPEFKDVEKLALEKAQEEKDHAFSTTKSVSLAKKLVDGTISLESTAQKFGLDLKHTPFFNRSDSIPGIGNLEKLKTKAFELNNGKTGWVLVRSNYYLIRLQERQKADAPDMETLKELRKKLKLEKGDSAFQEWMKNLKESSEILVDKSQI